MKKISIKILGSIWLSIIFCISVSALSKIIVWQLLWPEMFRFNLIDHIIEGTIFGLIIYFLFKYSKPAKKKK